MKYEISYLSKSGNATILAETAGGADISFIGFDVETGTIPLKIMDAVCAVKRKVL